MKIPFIQYHIVKSETLEDQQDVIDAMSTILSGAVPELEHVAIALHVVKRGGSAATRRKRGRALSRRVLELNKTFAEIYGVENE